MGGVEEERIPLTARQIEASLIDLHWQYASLIHEKTANALVSGLGAEATDAATGHALFARLFGEFAASLETFAAWCYALRVRSVPGSFLDAYLDYANRDVGEFYALVRDHEGDPVELLRLPPDDEIVAATVARHSEVPEGEIADLPAEGYSDSLRALGERLREAAERYFDTDRVLVDTYNKTKHGAPMVRLFEPDNPRSFEVVMRNRRAGEEGQPPYQFASFTVNREETTKMKGNVDAMTLSIRDMAAMTKILLDAGLLFEDPEPQAGGE